MNDLAIRAESLAKLYRLGPRERYKALRDTLTNAIYGPFRRLSQTVKQKRSSDDSSGFAAMSGTGHIWALKDVSFEVKHGEVIGIIGRNGAGKTTLLKILSRVTEPTEGCVEIRGRAGSLLEVGTGFHPELTGRENIFLNGAILGMKKTEIRRKFEEIVAFAEVEKFLDTPVKHYSGGMFIRLAFAVAAHLEPQILLVDEVLAVGDLSFQKKCLGKMGDVAKGGRTILFVSHQMNQIRRLCERAIWLDGGKIRKTGATVDVVSSYEAAMSTISHESVREEDDSHIGARFLKWEIVESQNEQSNILTTMGSTTLRFLLKVNRTIRNGHHGIALFSSENQLIWATAVNHLQLEPGICEFLYDFQTLPLRPGIYYWHVSLYDERGLVDVWFCAPEMVIATEPVGHPMDIWQGILNLPWRFRVR
jgi:ABC-type polysaccharide/polyol phosphate transport system ATPase subunit